jgi:hypothetical protein
MTLLQNLRLTSNKTGLTGWINPMRGNPRTAIYITACKREAS